MDDTQIEPHYCEYRYSDGTNCGEKCKVFESKSDKNPNRKYYKCLQRTDGHQHNFRRWVDEELEAPWAEHEGSKPSSTRQAPAVRMVRPPPAIAPSNEQVNVMERLEQMAALSERRHRELLALIRETHDMMRASMAPAYDPPQRLSYRR